MLKHIDGRRYPAGARRSPPALARRDPIGEDAFQRFKIAGIIGPVADPLTISRIALRPLTWLERFHISPALASFPAEVCPICQWSPFKLSGLLEYPETARACCARLRQCAGIIALHSERLVVIDRGVDLRANLFGNNRRWCDLNAFNHKPTQASPDLVNRPSIAGPSECWHREYGRASLA